jgi:hypothetical protein
MMMITIIIIYYRRLVLLRFGIVRTRYTFCNFRRFVRIPYVLSHYTFYRYIGTFYPLDVLSLYVLQRWASAILVRTSAIPQYCGQLNRLRNCGLKKVAELRLRTFKI